MKLMIGGRYQGKLAFAMEMAQVNETEVADGKACDFSQLNGKKIVNHLHDLIGRCLREEKEIEPLIREIINHGPDVIFICDEVGSGIVPADPAERAWREQTGRVCCQLAKEAEQVIRICCGIPTVIKGEAIC